MTASSPPLLASARSPLVPDTSVVLKWFLAAGEPDRDLALAIRLGFLVGKLRLVIPDLLLYELANVLRFKRDWDAARVATAVAALVSLRLEIVAVSPRLLERAVQIAYGFDVTVYDAAFAALAEHVGAAFVSADDRLIGKLGTLSYAQRLQSFVPG